MNYPDRLARAYAEMADLSDVGGDWAVVAGVVCSSVRELSFPWATQARALDPVAPSPAAVREVVGWLTARAADYTVAVRAERAGDWPDYSVWLRLGAFRLAGPVRRPPVPAGVEIGTAVSPEEFLVAYGPELAPLVTQRHFAAPNQHHLVARVDGAVVGCARFRITNGYAYVSGVGVLPAHRRRGIGAALSAEAARRAAPRAELVWLHAAEPVRAIYERLGFEHVADHVQLTPRSSRAGAAAGTGAQANNAR